MHDAVKGVGGGGMAGGKGEKGARPQANPLKKSNAVGHGMGLPSEEYRGFT